MDGQHLRPVVREHDAEIAAVRRVAGQRHHARVRQTALDQESIDADADIGAILSTSFAHNGHTASPSITRSPSASSPVGTRSVTPCHDVSAGTTAPSATTHSFSLSLIHISEPT